MKAASKMVSKHLLGYWQHKMISWLKRQIKATKIVQTYWRMYRAKKIALKLQKRKERKMKKETKEVEK